MCCFQRNNPLGDLLNCEFEDIWFGQLAEEIRQSTQDGILHSACQTTGCPFYKGIKPPFPQKDISHLPYPTSLEIDLPNTHCNVGLEQPGPAHPACIMCERSSPDFRPEYNCLSEILPKLKNLMPHLRHVHIQGIAEPFYKDLYFEILDALNFDQYRHFITISTTTNGTLFGTKKRQTYLHRVPRSSTCFSIDAATKETFQQIRILPLFDIVLESLYSFAKERNKRTQKLVINNNINTMNVNEIVGMVEIAAKAGVDYLEINPTDGFNTAILANEENCGKFLKAQMEMIDACKRLNVKYYLVRPLDFGLSQELAQITL